MRLLQRPGLFQRPRLLLRTTADENHDRQQQSLPRTTALALRMFWKGRAMTEDQQTAGPRSRAGSPSAAEAARQLLSRLAELARTSLQTEASLAKQTVDLTWGTLIGDLDRSNANKAYVESVTRESARYWGPSGSWASTTPATWSLWARACPQPSCGKWPRLAASPALGIPPVAPQPPQSRHRTT